MKKMEIAEKLNFALGLLDQVRVSGNNDRKLFVVAVENIMVAAKDIQDSILEEKNKEAKVPGKVNEEVVSDETAEAQ